MSEALGKRSRRILVVDDAPDAAESFTALLNAMGEKAEFITDPLDALEAVRRIRPEIVFLDIGMPEVNGWELASILRRELGPGVRIIAVSGYATVEDRMRSKVSGMDEHVQKPVNIDVIERILAGASG